MSPDRVRRLVDKHLARLTHRMGVWHWAIRVLPEAPEERDWKASCDRNTTYNTATVRVDPASVRDEADLVASRRHELAHVVLAPFDVYRHALTARIRDGSAEDRQERLLWTYAVEQAVIGLERMAHGHTHPPPKGAPVPLKKGYSRKTMAKNFAEIKQAKPRMPNSQRVAIVLNAARQSAAAAGKPAKGPPAPRKKRKRKA